MAGGGGGFLLFNLSAIAELIELCLLCEIMVTQFVSLRRGKLRQSIPLTLSKAMPSIINEGHNPLLSSIFRAIIFALLFLSQLAPPAKATATADASGTVLARVDVPGHLEALEFPIHAELTDAAGIRYALVIASLDSLRNSGIGYAVLDDYAPGRQYLIGRIRNAEIRRQAGSITGVLHDDGLQIIVRARPGVDTMLAGMGFRLQLLSETPIVLKRVSVGLGLKAAGAFEKNVMVSEMMGWVEKSAITGSISELSGQVPVTVESAPYTFSTRNTTSGEPIRKATQYAYEYFKSLGLTVSFQDWGPYSSLSNRNVVGELAGTTLADEIVLIVAHLDNMPSTGIAPGADDNASGCAAVMAAARIMKGYRFERTIRFVLFTGEEQGLYGSYFYANSVADQNIVAVLNLDMVGYNNGPPRQLLHIRSSANPQGNEADLAIADTFRNIIQNYGLSANLSTEIIADSEGYSDHYCFWNKGFPAVFIIEDWVGDETPFYHSAQDQLATLDMDYCTAIVKATLGTAAHLASPVGKNSGYLPWLELLL